MDYTHVNEDQKHAHYKHCSVILKSGLRVATNGENWILCEIRQGSTLRLARNETRQRRSSTATVGLNAPEQNIIITCSIAVKNVLICVSNCDNPLFHLSM